MPKGRAKRGVAKKHLELLDRLRAILRSSVPAEDMLRSVASLLAVEVGQYCIADVVGSDGAFERLEIEHADPSRRAPLRILCEDTVLGSGGRVARLATSGRAELIARVNGARGRALSDLRLLGDERVRSYMAAPVSVKGSTFALLTLVVTTGPRRYDDADLALLRAVADWVGLGLENAGRDRAHPRATPDLRRAVAGSGPVAHEMPEEAPTAVRRRNPLRR